MSVTMDQFRSLTARMIEQAKKDLLSEDDHLAIKAALYFFLEPVQSDDGDLKTFAGLCSATNINADAAAKAIFDELTTYQQDRIRDLLRSAGYKVQSNTPSSVNM